MGKFPRKIEGFVIDDLNIDTEELFDSEEDARDSIDIEEVERWQCVTCDEIYEDKDEAYSCCD